jgi:hypothetical protein
MSIKEKWKKKFKNEEFRIKLFTFFIIKSLILFLIFAIITKNLEFIYYDILLLFLVSIVYLIHRKIRMHLTVFISLCLVLLLHAAGGVIEIGGIRLYDFMMGAIKFDNIVHFLSSFVVVFITYNIIYNYIKKDRKQYISHLFFILIFMSVGFGALTEIIELMAVVFFNAAEGVGGYFNNALDLVVNLFGAVAGSVVVIYLHDNGFFNKLMGK